MTALPHPPPVLRPGVLYIAHDRFVCDSIQCAGASALYTAVTIGGAPVAPMRADDLREWGRLTDDPARCECGALTVPIPGPRP